MGGEVYSCHCPTTGRVGNLDLAGRPCLMSKSKDEKRKTPFTVEAVSLNRSEDTEREWIGINQNAANRYVEHFLVNGGFCDMVGEGNEVHREQFLGISKLDFLVGNTNIKNFYLIYEFNNLFIHSKTVGHRKKLLDKGLKRGYNINRKRQDL